MGRETIRGGIQGLQRDPTPRLRQRPKLPVICPPSGPDRGQRKHGQAGSKGAGDVWATDGGTQVRGRRADQQQLSAQAGRVAKGREPNYGGSAQQRSATRTATPIAASRPSL